MVTSVRDKFENENTWFRLSRTKEGAEEFHAKFEAAVKEVRGRLGRTLPMIINGEEVQGSGTFATTNPGNTDEVLQHFQKGTAEHVDRAVKAAKAAQPAWEQVGWEKRAAIIEKAADIMRERKYELSAVMTLENGKNRIEAMNDTDEAIDFLAYYALTMRANEGFVTRMTDPFPGEECWSVLRPWGVFAVIAPFNFPVAIFSGMTCGPLLTGNAVVVKPASDTPWSGYEAFRAFKDAGVPDGVLHFVTGGGREVGQAMMDHPGTDGVVFTGSRDVGMKNFAKFVGTRPRPYVCEMGGKNGIIVSDKADLDKAVPGVLASAFGFAGQKCSAASRAYVHERVYDAFMERFLTEVGKIKVGPGEEREPLYGPVINDQAVAKFEAAVNAVKDAGGTILHGGERLTDGSLGKGRFLAPTVVADLPFDHEAFRTEYFVPFIAVAKYRDFDEVMREVNATDYGLTGGIFTEDENEYRQYFERAHVGVVYANRTRGGSTGSMAGGQAFGGWNFSGTTGRGTGSPHYLQQFLREQSRTIVRD